MAVELRNALARLVGRTLPTSLVFDHPTAEALTAFLAVELGLAETRPSPAPPPSHIEEADIVDDDAADDDDAALSLLERKLSHAGY